MFLFNTPLTPSLSPNGARERFIRRYRNESTTDGTFLGTDIRTFSLDKAPYLHSVWNPQSPATEHSSQNGSHFVKLLVFDHKRRRNQKRIAGRFQVQPGFEQRFLHLMTAHARSFF